MTTKDQVAAWHAALCSVAGAFSGALARGRYSPRMVDVALATLKPVVRELEIASFKNEAQDQIEKETNDAERRGTTTRVERTRPEGGAGGKGPTARIKRTRR